MPALPRCCAAAVLGHDCCPGRPAPAITTSVMAAFGGPLHYFGAGFLLWELSTPLMCERPWVALRPAAHYRCSLLTATCSECRQLAMREHGAAHVAAFSTADVRWVLLKAGYGSSAIVSLANAAFMLVFFGCRNVWGPGA